MANYMKRIGSVYPSTIISASADTTNVASPPEPTINESNNIVDTETLATNVEDTTTDGTNDKLSSQT